MRIDQGTGIGDRESGRCRVLGVVLKLSTRSADKKLSPVSRSLFPQRGFTLIELIVFIVIISVALAGILEVMNKVTTHSADPLILKQEIAVAESMLEEIQLQDFIAASAHVPVTSANRSTTYHIVPDYNGYSTTGVFAPDGTAVAGLGNYNVAVGVVNEALGAIPAASAVRITVTVSNSQLATNDPLRQTVIDGYRTAY
jgi:MSHA pilin protein MshD